ncbi:MAG: hypothetical protein GY800_00525, partial [Planctomycetes bacterium]|nr:hypothetical protein [Planctomycetota bacterium]
MSKRNLILALFTALFLWQAPLSLKTDAALVQEGFKDLLFDAAMHIKQGEF